MTGRRNKPQDISELHSDITDLQSSVSELMDEFQHETSIFPDDTGKLLFVLLE